MISDDRKVLLLGQHLLVEPSEVNLLRIAHVEHIFKKCEMAEDILVWHLDRKSSLSPDTLH